MILYRLLSRRVPFTAQKRGIKISRRRRTGKHGPKKWYKGKGCPLIGEHDTRGIFRLGFTREKGHGSVDLDKVLDFKVPNLQGFKLRPYVTIEKPPDAN